MEITFSWILSQILTVVEYGLLGASYLAKRRKAVVILDIASMTCGIFAFILLGADLGMAMSVIILIANFYYLWEESPRHQEMKQARLKRKEQRARERQEKIRRALVLATVLLGIGVVTMMTYDGPLSLLSVAATVLYEISIWQKSTKVYKFLGIPVAFCWMTYNGFVNSPFGVLCELVMFVTSIVGYVREVKAQKAKKGSNGKRRAKTRKLEQSKKGTRRTKIQESKTRK